MGNPYPSTESTVAGRFFSAYSLCSMTRENADG